ncbi:unnamed protein product [Colias eurytheme]|nr:unnamed protein product [Colias eurytheme]
MASRRGLNPQDIIRCLEGSDIDVDESDEDDPAYNPIEEPHTSSESESEMSDESDELQNPNRDIRGRPRGRTSRGRRGRGRNNVSTSRPSTSGSTRNSEWVAKDFCVEEFEMSQPNYIPNWDESFDKINFFYQYIDDEIIDKIVECTNRSSIAIQGRSLNLDKRELYTYIGITFIMATLHYPWLRMYWEDKWRVPIIANNMSRNRFLILRNSIKFVFDNDITEDIRKRDKLWKVRPLLSRIQEGCRRQDKEKRLSIDEMIIPFTGTCGIKQFCPGKPNPVGLKAFVLANANGLVTDFDIYQGDTTYPGLQDSNFVLGEKAVLSLADALVPGHILYFDRYFSSLKLAKELLIRGIRSTGTIQKNRVPAAARDVLLEDKELSKRGRGSVHTVVNSDDTVAITKWNDNKPVTMMSTVEGREPEDVCQRWCKRTKRYVSVNRPLVVRNYNKYMGGVDLADRMLSVCPNRYRTKKWTQRLFSHMTDLAVTNSWLQYKKRELIKGVPVKKIQQLRSFKMELGEYLVELYSSPQTGDDEGTDSGDENAESGGKRKRGKPTTQLPSKRRRTAEAKHMPVFVESQSRCRHCHYNKSRTQCSTCNISLCLTKDRNCYMLFHEN